MHPRQCHCFFCFAVCGMGILPVVLRQVRAFSSAPPLSNFVAVRGSDKRPGKTLSYRNPRAQYFERRRTSKGVHATFTNNSESEAAARSSSLTILKPFEYDGWRLTYRTITEDRTGKHSNPSEHHNVLFVHPVGVGMASWFWEPLFAAIREKNGETNTAIRAFAPNLIGCGISEGSDAWDPDQRGMFVPLGWVKGCEALMNQITDNDRDNGDDESGGPQTKKWTIVTQGGLAPIGVLMAARNPERVSNLIMASPPTWKDMTTSVSGEEIERNYGFLRSPILGRLAFWILETRLLVEFFSNLFLFTSPEKRCDELWLDKTEQEMCAEARPPVQAFNSGMSLNRGLASELTEVIPSKIPKVLVVQGKNDNRPREEYEENMANCRLVTLEEPSNIVPWEQPESFANLLIETIAS